MDEVELMGKDPGVFGIVDFESAVWGDTVTSGLCQEGGGGVVCGED